MLTISSLLHRRGYAFANHVTGYNLDTTGQEGFSVIKYGSDDEYRPHCDGDCTGSEFRNGGRVATMVRAGTKKAGRGPSTGKFSSKDRGRAGSFLVPELYMYWRTHKGWDGGGGESGIG